MRPDIAFIPTPADAVAAMVELAAPGPEDVIYDLGCGDGRLLIAAAATGARGVGVDVDPMQVASAQEAAAAAELGEQLQFHVGNLYEWDLRPATGVFLYLLPHLNLRLRPELRSQLRPGSWIVSHQFDMGDWVPQRVVRLANEEESTIYRWEIPAVAPGE